MLDENNFAIVIFPLAIPYRQRILQSQTVFPGLRRNIMSALDNLTIGEAKQLAAMVVGLPTNGAVTTPTNGDGRAVIVRSRDAGVLFGEFRGNDGSTVHLTNARQLWKWRAEKGGTMVDVATYGVSKSGNKFSPAQAKMTIFNACALIDCTAEAADSIVKMEGEKWV